MLFAWSVLAGRKAGKLAKYPIEMLQIVKAAGITDVYDALLGVDQLFLCLQYAAVLQVFHNGYTGDLLKSMTQVITVDIKPVG